MPQQIIAAGGTMLFSAALRQGTSVASVVFPIDTNGVFTLEEYEAYNGGQVTGMMPLPDGNGYGIGAGFCYGSANGHYSDGTPSPDRFLCVGSQGTQTFSLTAEGLLAGLALGPDGDIWYTDAMLNGIGRFDPMLGPQAQYLNVETVLAPAAIVAGPDGAMWFTQGFGNKISRFAASTYDEFAVPTANARPLGLVVGSDGNLWFTELLGNRIGRITPAGAVTEFPVPSPGAQPLGIAAGSDGALWFSEFAANKIGRITTSGAVTEYPVPTSGSQPAGITSGPDGNIWFTEFHANRIGKLTFSGASTPCVADATTLCIDDQPGDGRYQAQVSFSTAQGGGASGNGQAIPLASLGVTHGGLFWFFSADNPELLVKVLPACGVNSHNWVFASAGTNVGVTLTVTDTRSGAQKVYTNPDLQSMEPIQDTAAFACTSPSSIASVPESLFATAAFTEEAVNRALVAMGEETRRSVGETPLTASSGGCVSSPTTLCIDGNPGDKRFQARVSFETSQGGGSSGNGTAIPLSSLGVTHGGLFWFFSADNPELLVKVLPACGVNSHDWVFASAGTNVGVTLTVTDTRSGEQKVYTNPDLQGMEPIQDTSAFASCP
jgi:streptogramin lyase/sugar/nucleoside kinase (ribokinase family)